MNAHYKKEYHLSVTTLGFYKGKLVVYFGLGVLITWYFASEYAGLGQ